VLKYFLLIPFLLTSFFHLIGQNPYDDCSKAYFVNNAQDWCSDAAAFNITDATPSKNSFSACYDELGKDIWLSFYGVASDVIITIKPEVGHKVSASLYEGDCNVQVEILCQEQKSGSDVLWMYKGGITQGHKYLLRIESKDVDPFAFSVCINNYFSPPKEGSDCDKANLLCSKNSFIVNNVVGFGFVQELVGVSCFGSSIESNSIWFKWKCKTPGDLSFTLNPLNADDDIDFVVYKVNGDEKSCDLEQVRCMAAGVIPSQCNTNNNCCGPTGLQIGEVDTEESAGCGPTKNNFLKPLDMLAGETYALIINNYTSMNEAFEISFSGSATFEGLKADFDISEKDGLCRTDTVSIKDLTINGIGNINNVKWVFGPDSDPETANASGDQKVIFNRSGNKSVSLIVENDIGCKSYYNDTLRVDCCGGELNADIGSDTVILAGDAIILKSSYLLEGSNISINWFPPGIFLCDTCANGFTIPLEEEQYVSAKIRDEFGCVAEDQLKVRVINNDIFVPNAFSPNDDGINDYFTIYSNESIKAVRVLRIYNRWGAQVFEGLNFEPNDESQGWNGTFRGKVASQGVYAYYAETLNKNGHITKLKGSLTLVR